MWNTLMWMMSLWPDNRHTHARRPHQPPPDRPGPSHLPSPPAVTPLTSSKSKALLAVVASFLATMAARRDTPAPAHTPGPSRSDDECGRSDAFQAQQGRLLAPPVPVV